MTFITYCIALSNKRIKEILTPNCSAESDPTIIFDLCALAVPLIELFAQSLVIHDTCLLLLHHCLRSCNCSNQFPVWCYQVAREEAPLANWAGQEFSDAASNVGPLPSPAVDESEPHLRCISVKLACEASAAWCLRAARTTPPLPACVLSASSLPMQRAAPSQGDWTSPTR